MSSSQPRHAMSDAVVSVTPPPMAPVDYEAKPLTRGEYVSALVHFYRGELARATDWRLRLDNTTNWAMLSVMGLLTFTLGDVTHPHAVILLAMVLISTFWVIEARRFRIFDVWRARVRMLEINFYGPILRRELTSPIEDWGGQVAEHLMYPTFRMTRFAALAARLRSNYLPLYVVLLAAWWLKLELHTTGGSMLDRMAIGTVPGTIVAGLVALFYGALLAMLFTVRPSPLVDPEQTYFDRGDGATLR